MCKNKWTDWQMVYHWAGSKEKLCDISLVFNVLWVNGYGMIVGIVHVCMPLSHLLTPGDCLG